MSLFAPAPHPDSFLAQFPTSKGDLSLPFGQHISLHHRRLGMDIDHDAMAGDTTARFFGQPYYAILSLSHPMLIVTSVGFHSFHSAMLTQLTYYYTIGHRLRQVSKPRGSGSIEKKSGTLFVRASRFQVQQELSTRHLASLHTWPADSFEPQWLLWLLRRYAPAHAQRCASHRQQQTPQDNWWRHRG